MFKLFTKRALMALTLVVCASSGFSLFAGMPAVMQGGKPEGPWQKACFLKEGKYPQCI